MRSRTRQRVHAWLMQTYGAVGNSAAAAASIAGLLGDATPKTTLARASTRFRCVDLSKISYEDLLPDARSDLYGQSVKTLPGSCDAFISHSWRDCPTAKWFALQTWRSEFVVKHGREPQVWLDRFCIDQTNIDVDLRS